LGCIFEVELVTPLAVELVNLSHLLNSNHPTDYLLNKPASALHNLFTS
jgi:hypothetical protein